MAIINLSLYIALVMYLNPNVYHASMDHVDLSNIPEDNAYAFRTSPRRHAGCRICTEGSSAIGTGLLHSTYQSRGEVEPALAMES